MIVAFALSDSPNDPGKVDPQATLDIPDEVEQAVSAEDEAEIKEKLVKAEEEVRKLAKENMPASGPDKPSAAQPAAPQKAEKATNGQAAEENSEQADLEDYGTALQEHFAKYNKYPSEAKEQGAEGTAIVYLKIDRTGKVLAARLEQKTGHDILDKAVADMVRSANPFPAMPEDYRKDQKFSEFMVPIIFSN